MAPPSEAELILTAHALALEVASSRQIDNDSLDGSFCNQHLRGNVSNAVGGPEKGATADMA